MAMLQKHWPHDKLMEIRHIIDGRPLSKKIETHHGRNMLLTNKKGGYYCIGPSSKHSGLFFRLDGKLYRIMESMGAPGEIKGVTNNFWNLEIRKEGLSERFYMPLYTNALVYEIDGTAPIDIFLDMKEAGDHRSTGRSHRLTLGKNLILIEYTKSIDSPHNGPRHGYQLFMAIAGENFIHREKIGTWKKSEYLLDRQMGEPPFEAEVYHALRLFSRKIVLSASLSRKEAIETAKKVFRNLPRVSEIQRQYHGTAIKRTGKSEIDAAYKAALNSLDALTFKQGGQNHIYSGLPFSPEESQRDEAIALKALLLAGQLKISKELILSQLDELETNPTKIGADSLGWHFRRWADLITILSEKGIYQEYLKGEELERITRLLEKILASAKKSCLDNEGLALSGPGQSWMSSLERSGPRLEHQAMMLSMLRLMYKLTINEEYLMQEMDLKKKVLDGFWNGKYLRDGPDDGAVRPNIFLAAYFYPDLLIKKEWEACFTFALARLWSGAAGLSTLDRTSSQFSPEYDPLKPATKYNGPPHFWLNNIAAIAMHNINPKKFSRYITRLASISTKDILWKGAINTPSEFSSADRLTSQGNLCSAISSATYIEMMDALYLKGLRQVD